MKGVVGFLLIALAPYVLSQQVTGCYDKLSAAQTAFNNALSISGSLNWFNTDSLWNFIQTKYMSDPPHGFRSVCMASKAYKSSLQFDYIPCVETLRLLRNDDGTATNVTLHQAMDYFAIVSTFDFTCGAGFGVFANSPNYCIANIFNTSSVQLKQCRDNFKYQAINGQSNMLCDYMGDLLTCYKNQFAPCGHMGTYFGCEYARTGAINMFPHCMSVSNDCLVNDFGQ